MSKALTKTDQEMIADRQLFVATSRVQLLRLIAPANEEFARDLIADIQRASEAIGMVEGYAEARSRYREVPAV